jgi:hypothetical protein
VAIQWDVADKTAKVTHWATMLAARTPAKTRPLIEVRLVITVRTMAGRAKARVKKMIALPTIGFASLAPNPPVENVATISSPKNNA